MARASQTERADALVARIEAETEEELGKIRAAAEAEATILVRDAHARARQRVHEEIVALRRQRAEALRQETARLDTARRQLKQREAGAFVAAGLPVLAAALSGLWRDRATRAAWVETVLTSAAQRLFPGEWLVEHPADWPEAERQALAEAIEARTGKRPDFHEDPVLVAGLRVRMGGVCLDASAAALLGTEDRAGAALLAEAARTAAEEPS